MKVLAGIAGAFIFTLAIAFAQWRNEVHLPLNEAIVCGLIAAAGFALMAYSVSIRAMVVVDGLIVAALYFIVIPFVEGGLMRDGKKPFDEATRLYRADRYSEAVPLFDDYLKTNPNDALAHARIAICLGQLGRLEEAI